MLVSKYHIFLFCLTLIGASDNQTVNCCNFTPRYYPPIEKLISYPDANFQCYVLTYGVGYKGNTPEAFRWGVQLIPHTEPVVVIGSKSLNIQLVDRNELITKLATAEHMPKFNDTYDYCFDMVLLHSRIDVKIDKTYKIINAIRDNEELADYTYYTG